MAPPSTGTARKKSNSCLAVVAILGFAFCVLPAGFSAFIIVEAHRSDVARAAREASRIKIPVITHHICEVDGKDPSGPDTTTTELAYPDAPEAKVGKIEKTEKKGFCPRHAAERVELDRVDIATCSVNPKDRATRKTFQHLPRGRLPADAKATNANLDIYAFMSEETSPKACKSAESRTLLACGKAPVRSGWDGSYSAVDHFLEETLNDPSSYKTEGCSGPSYDPRHTSNCWYVECSYRAKNGFGAVILETRGFYVSGDRVIRTTGPL